MHYSSHKERVIRISSYLFVRTGGLTATRVESILRTGLNDSVFNDPTMTVDHIRIGLVEFGLLERNDDGSRYRIDMNEFMSESNIRGILGSDYPAARIKSSKQLVSRIVDYATRRKIISVVKVNNLLRPSDRGPYRT